MAEHVGFDADRDFLTLQGKRHFVPVDFGKEDFHRRVEPRARAGRPGDQQRPLAPRQELAVEQQERQPAEMVAVQMREHDARRSGSDRA